MISPNESGTSPDEIIELLGSLGEESRGKVIFLDTLKKFVDMMNKRAQAKFFDALRNINAYNGTIILAGHANKHKDQNGKLVYEGTSDTISDVDCVYSINVLTDRDEEEQVVEFRCEKDRGDMVQRKSFSYIKRDGMSYIERLDSIEELNDLIVDDIITEKKNQEAKEKYKAQILFVMELLKKGSKNQSEIIDAYKSGHYPQSAEFSEKTLRTALNRLDGIVWKSRRGDKNALIFTLPS
jgi:hypothetical protein